MNKIYEALSCETKNHNEENDCAVRAVAAVTGVSYSDVLRMMACYGREPRKGTVFEITYQVLNHYGFKNTDISHLFHSRTVRTLEREMRNVKGKFLVRTRGHVLAVVDGEVCDWTKGRLHRIRKIWKVESKGVVR